MRIEFNNPYNKIPLVNGKNKSNYTAPLLKGDTFEKSSNVSFGNTDFWDIVINSFSTALEEIRQETAMSAYLTVFSEKSIRKKLSSFKDKNISLEKFNILPNSLGDNVSYINKIFNQAGINNLAQLEIFLRHFTSNPMTPKIYKGQNVEAVQIYGILNKKSDLAKFPELALTIYQEQENSPKPSFDILNNYFDVLRALGVEKESDIDEKFNYLKPKFNNFETSTDKLNAINYIVVTLNTKTQMLGEILQQSPELSDLDSLDVYIELNDIVNYLYEKNNGKNLDNLPFFIDTALSAGKLKQQKKAEELFGPLSDTENKIEFYTLLKECGISVNEFNFLAKPNIVMDLPLLDILIYKQTITDEMKKAGETNNPASEELYKNLYPIFTAVYTRGDNQEDSESLKTAVNLINKYKIKTQNDFLNFYNKVYGAKERKLTIEKICELTDLFKFDDEINILDTARKSNTTPKAVLEKKKEHFSAREKEINNFLETTSSEALIGKSAFEIYKEYPFLTDVKPENIAETLELGIKSGLYEKDSEIAEKEFIEFAKFFPSKKEALSFIINGKIKFDNSNDSINYRNACLDIVQSLYENENSETFVERVQKLTKLGFLTKSKQSLPNFVSEMKSLGLLKEIINSVIDNEIPSVRVLNNFLKKYETRPDNHLNLIKHILTIPKNIHFNQYTDFIKRLNEKIKSYQVNKSINNDNILNIDINKYFNKKSYSTKDINELLCNVSGKRNSDISFISLLNKSYTNECEEYSPFKIAKEIANRIDTSDESYQNISKELGLDRKSLGLDNDCSRYIYIKEIAKRLPSELIQFVNSNKWLNFNNNGQIPDMTLHSRLRIIDRFALSDNRSIKNLNTEETTCLLKNILKSIYTQIPIQIKGHEESKRIIIQTVYNNQTIESVFNGEGKLITAIGVN